MTRTFSPMGKIVIASTFVGASSRRGLLSQVTTRVFQTLAGIATGTKGAFALGQVGCSGTPCNNQSVCEGDGSCAGMSGDDSDCPNNPVIPNEDGACWYIMS